jgi:hypothetical protein
MRLSFFSLIGLSTYKMGDGEGLVVLRILNYFFSSNAGLCTYSVGSIIGISSIESILCRDFLIRDPSASVVIS